MKHLGSWVLVSAMLGVGCLPAARSSANGSALIHPKFPYGVVYDDPGQASVLGNDWRLENYRRQSDDPSKPATIERKDGYDTAYQFDFNDDDKADATQRLPYPDLVFLHRKTNARLEVATVLLDDTLGDKELRVLLDDIVESQSGTRSLFVGLGGKVSAGVQKRFASRLLDSEEATLAGQKGLAATFERADIDQLQLNPNARWRRSRLFLMHAPFDYYVPDAPMASASDSGVVAIGGSMSPATATKFHKYAVLLVVEYTNTPEDFEAQYPEFVRLLNKTHTLTDAMLLAYLAEPLEPCSQPGTAAKLSVSINEVGVASIQDSEGLDSTCTSQVVSPYVFGATGKEHVASAQYDFSRHKKAEWLTQEGYSEQRPVAAAAAEPNASPSPTAPPPAATPEAPSVAVPAAPNTSPEPSELPSAAPADPK